MRNSTGGLLNPRDLVLIFQGRARTWVVPRLCVCHPERSVSACERAVEGSRECRRPCMPQQGVLSRELPDAAWVDGTSSRSFDFGLAPFGRSACAQDDRVK